MEGFRPLEQMLAVVLAAGRGTRLGPLTDRRSKAMMPVAGKPMIERVLEMLASGGANRFVVVVHPGDSQLARHLERSSWAAQVELAYQEQRLGMANALACATALIRQTNVADFLLASCDNLYPVGHIAALLKRHSEEAFDATLTLLSTTPQEATDSALVILHDGLVKDLVEKPSRRRVSREVLTSDVLIAPSLYALSARILGYLPMVSQSVRGEYEFPDALRLLIARGGVVGGQLAEERMTLTRPSDLLEINRYFLRSNPRAAVVETTLPPQTTISPPVCIEAGARIESGCRLGPEVYLESGCSVHQGSTISRAVVLRGGSVVADQLIDEAVIA